MEYSPPMAQNQRLGYRLSREQTSHPESPQTYRGRYHHPPEHWPRSSDPEYMYPPSHHSGVSYKRSYSGDSYDAPVHPSQQYYSSKRMRSSSAPTDIRNYEREEMAMHWQGNRERSAYYSYSNQGRHLSYSRPSRREPERFSEQSPSYPRDGFKDRHYDDDESRADRGDHRAERPSLHETALLNRSPNDVREIQSKLPDTPSSPYHQRPPPYLGEPYHHANRHHLEQQRDERNDKETIVRTASGSGEISRDRFLPEEHVQDRFYPSKSPREPHRIIPPSVSLPRNNHNRPSDAYGYRPPQERTGPRAGMSVALLQAASDAKVTHSNDSVRVPVGMVNRSIPANKAKQEGLVLISGGSNAETSDASSLMGASGERVRGDRAGPSASPSRVLLALPEDRIALSEALCIIRENVEVFRASPTDVDAPAPGRKNPVVVGQVGLRCIHCCHSKDRVKRAVCYPSSIRRIYRTITDMKLDHFGACPYVPGEIKERLDELKVVSARSTGTTMRYFVDSAKKLNMVDASNGIRFQCDVPSPATPSSPALGPSRARYASSDASCTSSPKDSTTSMMSLISTSNKLLGGSVAHSKSMSFDTLPLAKSTLSSDTEAGDSMHPSENDNHGSTVPVSISNMEERAALRGETQSHGKMYTGKVPLNLPEDKFMLSPLRCFLRENVYVFSASEEDIAARTPTNFSVVLGQVGICCMHCFALPPKDRTNRAVCFPFSIDRIYQSVADMQRFHFNVCKEVPPDVKDKFTSLKSASSKGSKGLATRQYWITSAKKLGLVDSASGIRFGRDPLSSAEPAVSLDILAQAALDLTKRRPLVFAEDKPLIADFLFLVMQQLQPCQFTEADRNKRRMKEVGCIGVECKHCVGQAESRKFFWSSVNAVESNFISVHTHLMECKWVPNDITEKLAQLKLLRKEQTARLKTGSQKAFFARVWERLHSYEGVVKKTTESERGHGSSGQGQCAEV